MAKDFDAQVESFRALHKAAETDRDATLKRCAELERIKAVIRTLHPATSNAIPARSAAEWGAAIKAKAQGLQQ